MKPQSKDSHQCNLQGLAYWGTQQGGETWKMDLEGKTEDTHQSPPFLPLSIHSCPLGEKSMFLKQEMYGVLVECLSSSHFPGKDSMRLIFQQPSKDGKGSCSQTIKVQKNTNKKTLLKENLIMCNNVYNSTCDHLITASASGHKRSKESKRVIVVLIRRLNIFATI